MALTTKDKVDIFRYRFGFKNLRTAFKYLFRGILRPMRETLFPKLWYYKADFGVAMDDAGVKKAEVGISRILVIPTPSTVHYFVRVLRPGILIGRKGVSIGAMQKTLEKLTNKKVKIHLRDFDPYWD